MSDPYFATRCSFCGRGDDDVALLIGPRVSICTACVAIAVGEMQAALGDGVKMAVTSNIDAAASGLFAEVPE
jgi:hypothetical protein